jgi:hypothetical protein
MTLAEIATKTRDLTGQDSTSYSNAKLAVDLTIWQGKLVSMILESADDAGYDDPRWGDFPIQSTDLVSGQRRYGFAVSDAVISFDRVDVSYDGTTWVKAEPLDVTRLTFALDDGVTAASQNLVDANFSTSAPRYDIEGGFNIALYPRPTTSDGQIVVRCSRVAKPISESDVSTGTAVPGFDVNFHFMLAYGAASEFGAAHQIANAGAIASALGDGEARLRRQYGRKQPDYQIAVTSGVSTDDYR